MERAVEDYPRTLAELEARFSSEEACREYLFRLRWPEGFRCWRCGEGKTWPLRSGRFQCAGCGHQVSVTAGTIFQGTRTPLTVWFRAMWWVTSQKNGVSALGLQRVLGLGSYQTAWAWLHKLRRAMVRPGRDRLSGRVEVDETYLGGLEQGVHGRQTESKALICGRGPGGRQRYRTDSHAAHPRRISPKPGSIRGGVGRAGQRGSHRWLVGLCSVGEQGLHPQDHLSSRKQEISVGVAAASPSCGVAVKAMAAGHPSGCRQFRTFGLLPG